MAFTWTPITADQTAHSKAILEEMRANLDSVKDNEACVADDTGYYADHDAGIDSAYDATYNSGHRATVDSADDATVHGTYQAGVDSSYYSGYNSGDNVYYA